MIIRKFNDKGMSWFKEYVQNYDVVKRPTFPADIIHNDEYTDRMESDVSVAILDGINLADKLSAAKTLNDLVVKLGLVSAERNAEFWTWCSAYLFERLCQQDGQKFKLGDWPVWVYKPKDYSRYYRHYLASIWRIYHAHRNQTGESILVMLNGPVNVQGDLYESVAANQKLVTNPSMIDTFYQLFWDKQLLKKKKGSESKTGGRRLVEVLKQLERNFDFFSMSADKIIALLPEEFDRYRAKPSNESNRSVVSRISEAVTGAVSKLIPHAGTGA